MSLFSEKDRTKTYNTGLSNEQREFLNNFQNISANEN